MSGPLESSVTVEDVLAVVSAKRVPLAAELAGYLALEMAEGAGNVAGALDAENVYISDEGTVALVRARRDGDVEESVRVLLGRLLEAGGTQTPALGSAARKAAGAGITALARELEAALIPVNRAAGRRALARLAREVKRVTHGVGRNASLPPAERGARGSSPDSKRGSAPSFADEELPTTAKRAAPEAVVAEARDRAPMLQRPASDQLPTLELSKAAAQQLQAMPEATRDSNRPPGETGVPVVDGETTKPRPPPVRPAAGAAPEVAAAAPAPDADALHPMQDAPKDEVDELLSSFGVSGQKEEKGHRHDLKAIAGLEPTPPPPGVPRYDDEPDASDASVEDLLSLSSRESTPPPPAKPQAALPVKPAPANPVAHEEETPRPPARRQSAPEEREERPSYADDRSMPTAPAQRRAAPPKKRSIVDSILWVLIAALVGAGGFLLWKFRTGSLIPPPPPAPSANVEPPKPSEADLKRACKASILVDGAPEKSEILLRVGQAPIEVEKMPVGARLEFVATAEGHAPKRAVVPAGVAWEKGADGKPRYELAVQLDPSRAKGGLDAWPPSEPGSSAGGDGPPGTVRVVSTPKGAEVWLVVGVGPEALIERLSCIGDAQIMVAGATPQQRKRFMIREADYADVPGKENQKRAKLSAK